VGKAARLKRLKSAAREKSTQNDAIGLSLPWLSGLTFLFDEDVRPYEEQLDKMFNTFAAKIGTSWMRLGPTNADGSMEELSYWIDIDKATHRFAKDRGFNLRLARNHIDQELLGFIPAEILWCCCNVKAYTAPGAPDLSYCGFTPAKDSV